MYDINLVVEHKLFSGIEKNNTDYLSGLGENVYKIKQYLKRIVLFVSQDFLPEFSKMIILANENIDLLRQYEFANN